MPKSAEDIHEFQFHECLLAVQKSQLTRLNCYLPIIVCRSLAPSLLPAPSLSLDSVCLCFAAGLAQQAELY